MKIVTMSHRNPEIGIFNGAASLNVYNLKYLIYLGMGRIESYRFDRFHCKYDQNTGSADFYRLSVRPFSPRRYQRWFPVCFLEIWFVLVCSVLDVLYGCLTKRGHGDTVSVF